MTVQTLPTEHAEAATCGVHHPQVLPYEHDASLIEVLTQLAYRKWLIAKVTCTAMLIGLVLCFALPVRYTATTKIMPPQQTQSTASMLMTQLAGSGAGSLAAIAGGGLGLKNPNDLYVGMLTSRPVADAIIQKYGLANVYHSKNMTQARKKLADYTEVTSEKNGFIAVSVTDTDKKRAAEMANAYADQLRVLTKTLAVTEASQRRLFYEEQLKQAKDALVAAELAFQQVQQQKGLVQLDAQAKAIIEGIAALRAQVAAKQVEVQALRSYSTEQNPDVQLAEKELTSLQAEESRLEQTNHSPGIAGLGLGNVPAAGLEYLRAAHELAYRQALFDMLMKQYDAARLDEAKDAAIIQVVESAIEPDRKSSPSRALIVMLFAFVGFFSGCILALLEWWRNIVQSDPIAAKQFEELSYALMGRKISSS
ncbi:MAG TPA: Wzz/FepE/Etk N-terminal domain-containing protein [Terracidiphilus sp.]|nr:Wzz/FepE/Etk N-terminal domain-containing protein [Terracidiphilus sp.]